VPTLEQQFHDSMAAIGTADVDLLSKVLTDPAAVTVEEQSSAADKLGLKNPFARFVVNTVTDPVVWIAMLMDKRFPPITWLRGQIPKRFVADANEWTGVGFFTRPVETYFRGTPIPRLVAIQQMREAKVREIGSKMLEVMRRPKWAEEMPIVSMLMEGEMVAGATPELHVVAKQLRGNMDDIWNLLKNTRKIRGGFDGTEITEARLEPWGRQEAPKYLRDYLPHIPLLGDESIVRMDPEEAIGRMGLGRVRQVLEAAGENPGHVWTVDAANRLSSNYARYQSFLNRTQGQIFNQHLFRRQRFGIPLHSLQGQELWITDLNVALQKYVQSAARTYALNTPLTAHERALATVYRPDGPPIVPTDEPIIVQVMNQGLRAIGGKVSERPVAGTNIIERRLVPNSANPFGLTALRNLVRNMRGDMDTGEILVNNLFSAVGAKFDAATANVRGRDKAAVDYALNTMRRDRQWRSIINGTTSYFYASTLGLNPWSAIQNVLQPALTTAPALGVGPTLAGAREMLSRMPRYSREVGNQYRLLSGSAIGERLTRPERFFHNMNEAAQRAFNTTFPELAESGLKLDPRLFDINPNTTMAWGPRATRGFRSYDDFARWLLQPFTHAELANQATTFFASRHALKNAMRRGEYQVPLSVEGRPLVGQELEEWLNFESSRIVNATQFRPGPGARSSFQSVLPAPLRMFTSFPTRALSFMAESTVRGAMTQEQLAGANILERMTGGRNWGTVARMILYGKLLTNGAKEALGLDLGHAVGLTAPFTFTPQGQYLSPLPVSPVAGAVIGSISAAASRDIKTMKPMYLPGVGAIPIPKTLLPGGVAITRAVKAVQQWRPDVGGFVDDDERLMYRGNSTDLILAMLGIPTEKSRRTREYMERIHDVRMRVRDFRRRYAQAYTNLDFETMGSLRSKWKESFPDWPALSVSPQDVRRYQRAGRIPMIQRMLKTMGDSGRYLESEIYEADPEILAPQMPVGFLQAG